MNDPDTTPNAAACFRARAERFGIAADDAHLEVLRGVVRDNDAVMAAVDASTRVRSEDPSEFMRVMRGWRERHAG